MILEPFCLWEKLQIQKRDQKGKGIRYFLFPFVIQYEVQNVRLNTIFQDFKSQLEKLDNISEDFIPTQDELATVISSTNAVGQRPIIRPDPSDLNSDREIINITIQVFSSPEPSEVVKKISKFERLLNFIRQSLSKNK